MGAEPSVKSCMPRRSARLTGAGSFTDCCARGCYESGPQRECLASPPSRTVLASPLPGCTRYARLLPPSGGSVTRRDPATGSVVAAAADALHERAAVPSGRRRLHSLSPQTAASRYGRAKARVSGAQSHPR